MGDKSQTKNWIDILSDKNGDIELSFSIKHIKNLVLASVQYGFHYDAPPKSIIINIAKGSVDFYTSKNTRHNE